MTTRTTSAETPTCPSCGRGVEPTTTSCPSCGHSTLVDLRVLTPVADHRRAYESARALCQLAPGTHFPEVKHALETGGAVVLSALPPGPAAAALAALAKQGAPGYLSPHGTAPAASARRSGAPRLLIASGLALAAGLAAWLWNASSSPPAEPLGHPPSRGRATPVAAAPRPSPSPAAEPAEPEAESESPATELTFDDADAGRQLREGIGERPVLAAAVLLPDDAIALVLARLAAEAPAAEAVEAGIWRHSMEVCHPTGLIVDWTGYELEPLADYLEPQAYAVLQRDAGDWKLWIGTAVVITPDSCGPPATYLAAEVRLTGANPEADRAILERGGLPGT